MIKLKKHYNYSLMVLVFSVSLSFPFRAAAVDVGDTLEVIPVVGTTQNIIPIITDPFILTGHTYHITFYGDSAALDTMLFWRLTDQTAGIIKLDSVLVMKDTVFFHPVVDGIEWQIFNPGFDFSNFLVVANGAGSLDPEEMGCFAFNANGFPLLYNARYPTGTDRPTPGVQQSTNNSTWGIHTGMTDPGMDFSFDYFKARVTRGGSSWPYIIPYDFEIRFTTAGGQGQMAFTTGTIVNVPFELWNIGIAAFNDISDDYRLIPLLLDFDEDDTFNLVRDDHSLSGGTNDPYTDWIYFYIPDNTTPGQWGYDEVIANSFNSGFTFNALARIVLVNWNGGDVTDTLNWPNNVNSLMPEEGTVFRIVSTKPNFPGDELSVIAPESKREITVNSPNGGESWQVGTVHDINWVSTNVNNIRIEYSTDNGSSYIEVVSSALASLGTYNWTIPNTPSADCLIRISDVSNSSIYDNSNNLFIIYLSIDATTHAATNITQTSATLSGTVNPNGLNTEVKFQWGTSTSYGNEIAGSPSPITGTTAQSVTANLTGLAANTTYHYRVVATNAAGETNGTDQSFRTYSSTYNLTNNTSFPSHQDLNDYQSSDYRLIGIPGNNNNLVSVFLTGTQGNDWQVYWDNGSSSADQNVYLDKYDGGSDFLCSVGRAFWLINKGNWQITNLSVNTANLNTNGEVEIPLHSGWNIITNPFAAAISWSGVQTVNSISTPIWHYQGSQGYQQASEYEPYTGYYFDNQSNLPVLKIPYSLTFGTAQQLAGKDPASWRVKVCFSQGDYRDETVSLGTAIGSKAGMDGLDHRKPRGMGGNPTVYMVHPERGGQYASDIRGEGIEVEEWELAIETEIREAGWLTFDGVGDIPPEQEIYLVDEEGGRWVDLRTDSVYTFSPMRKKMRFEVLVGGQSQIAARLEEVVPREFGLGQNYPNPFNPITVIPVVIAERCEIEVVVYTMLGQRVETIYRGEVEAGRYGYSWDGRDDQDRELSAGIYLYRLTTSTGFQSARKLILLK